MPSKEKKEKKEKKWKKPQKIKIKNSKMPKRQIIISIVNETLNGYCITVLSLLEIQLFKLSIRDSPTY